MVRITVVDKVIVDLRTAVMDDLRVDTVVLWAIVFTSEVDRDLSILQSYTLLYNDLNPF